MSSDSKQSDASEKSEEEVFDQLEAKQEQVSQEKKWCHSWSGLN
jgi:hypothetical protein